ncbi:MAG TPA: chemotaxis protein CheW [Synergistaceae bacterium]|nr:chemotaxis protein CheW [Synergistaceae bacterium]HQK26004.1 chemotaxis protein CheW [Synergistaceae bacterium]
MREPVLAFSVAERRFALPLSEVDRIVAAVEIQDLPQAPAFVRGVVNVGGALVPVVDLRVLRALPPREMELSDRMILVRPEGARPSFSSPGEGLPPEGLFRGAFALWVDEVEGVIPLEWQDISLDEGTVKLPRVALTPGDDRLLVLQGRESLRAETTAPGAGPHG